MVDIFRIYRHCNEGLIKRFNDSKPKGNFLIEIIEKRLQI